MINYEKFDCRGTISCDACPASNEFDAYNFQDLVNQAKNDSWVIVKDDLNWLHYIYTHKDKKV